MKAHRVIAAALLFLAGAGSGCATLTNLESPRTLEPGRWTVELEGRALATRSEAVNDGQTPHAVSVHLGVSDGFELGARAGFSRPELLAKWRLGRGGAGGTSGPAIALSESVGLWRYALAIPQWQVHSRTAVPIGIPLGDSDLILTPALHLVYGHSDTGLWGVTSLPSASVGWMWRGFRWLAVVPEVTFGYSLLTVATGGWVVGGGFALEAGLGLIFGGAEGF